MLFIVSPLDNWVSHHKGCREEVVKYFKIHGKSTYLILSPFTGGIRQKRWSGTHSKKIFSLIDTLYCLILLVFRKKRLSSIFFIDGSISLIVLFSFFSKNKIFYNLYGEFNPTGILRFLINYLSERKKIYFLAERSNLFPIDKTNNIIFPYIPKNPVFLGTQNEARKYCLIPDNIEIVVALPGTVRRSKNYGLIFRSLASLKKICFLIFGKEVDDSGLEAAKKYLNGNILIFRDEFCSDYNYSAMLKASDCVILAYPSDYNRGSGTVYDALIHQRLVFASNCETFNEIAENNKNIILFNLENSDELAGKFQSRKFIFEDDLKLPNYSCLIDTVNSIVDF